MMKKAVSLLLMLCLMLPVCCAAASAAGNASVYSEEEFFFQFPDVEGTVTIPGGANGDFYVIDYVQDLHIRGNLVIEENANFELWEDCTLTVDGDLVNSGTLVADKGAVVTVSGECINNRDITMMEQSLFFPAGGLSNYGSFTLAGIYGCGVIGARDGEPQTLTYRDGSESDDPEAAVGKAMCAGGSVILFQLDEEHPADIGAAADDLRALIPQDAQNTEDPYGFGYATIYGYAHELGEMIDYNEDDRLDGVYVEGRSDRELIPVGEDLTISKKLCVGPCDLVLQNGKTLTVSDPDNNLLFRENGRFVCEAQGAAYPDAPAGGTLALGDAALLSGDPAKAPINPTRDIVWLTSYGDEDGRYPAPGNCVVIGGGSGADVHGESPLLSNTNVIMEGADANLRLTDDFTCLNIVLRGDVDLNGHALTADCVYYTNGSRVQENGGTVSGTPRYELIFSLGPYGTYDDIDYPGGQALYPADYLAVPMSEVESDPAFRGWRFDSGWDVPEQELNQLGFTVDGDSESPYYQEYYLEMPFYPLMISAQWDTVRVELTQYDATVAFDGINGHEYSMQVLDLLYSSDDEIAAFGADRDLLNRIAGAAADQAPGEMLDFMSFRLYDGVNQMDDVPFELRVKLPAGADAYESVQLKAIHIDDDASVHVDPQMIPCCVENGVLIAAPERNASAFILVGGNGQEISRVELELERPHGGSFTDTPATPDDSDWERHRQSNKPRVHYQNGPGAYVESTLWTLPGEGEVPFIGTFENGRSYTFQTMVLVEPGYTFSDDVEIVFRGAAYQTHTTHIMDENGKCDILYITATMKPYPAGVKLGDTDGDGDVTILDATYIQRELAALKNEVFIDEAADADCDGSLTILDATAIQRWLAGLDVSAPIGEEL